MTGLRSATVLPYLLFGSLCVLIGSSIYILMPQALLSLNLGLLLDIFFAILLGMILGMTLLAVNFRGFLEFLLVYVLLFWERSSMRVLLRKNLMAHRRNNQLTSIIYALTLGTIIFLIVAARLELQIISAASLVPGVDVQVGGDGVYYDYLNGTLCDPVLVQYAD